MTKRPSARSARHARPGEPEHRLRLSEPADVLRAIPYLLGFHPDRSLVLVGLTTRGGPSNTSRVCLTARVDIDDVRNYPAAVPSAAGAADRAGADAVIVAFFADDVEQAMSWATLMPDIAGWCADAGLTVPNWLFHGADGWATAHCVGDEVVFAGPFDHHPDTRVAAEATYAGLVARRDRAALAALIAPEPAARRDLLVGALARQVRADTPGDDRSRRSHVRALFAASRALPLMEAGQVVRFGAALTDVEVRDACWLAIESRRIGDDGLWRELSRQLPDQFRPAPLFLLGWQSWRAGNGALALIAADEALRCDPAYGAAELLVGALQSGLDPRRTRRLRKGA